MTTKSRSGFGNDSTRLRHTISNWNDVFYLMLSIVPWWTMVILPRLKISYLYDSMLRLSTLLTLVHRARVDQGSTISEFIGYAEKTTEEIFWLKNSFEHDDRQLEIFRHDWSNLWCWWWNLGKSLYWHWSYQPRCETGQNTSGEESLLGQVNWKLAACNALDV